MAARRPAGARIAWPALLGSVLLLGACADDGPAKTVVAAPGQTATWRIVVWGAGDERDPRIAEAVGQELLHRGLAASIVRGAAKADHVLQVTASPLVFPAQESVRDGRDARLLQQFSFHTDTPTSGAATDAMSDPTKALAISIADRLAASPEFKPKAPPPPAPAPQ